MTRAFEQPVTRARLGRVLGYLKPYWPQWIAILLCIAAIAGMGVVPPLLVRGILDHAIPERNPHLLHLLVGGIVGVAVVSGLINVLQSWLNARVGQGIMFDLRNQLYRHLQRMSLGFYTTERAGEIVSRLNNDVGAVRDVATGTVTNIARNLFTLIATLIAIFSLNPQLALLSIAIVPLLSTHAYRRPHSPPPLAPDAGAGCRDGRLHGGAAQHRGMMLA